MFVNVNKYHLKSIHYDFSLVGSVLYFFNSCYGFLLANRLRSNLVHATGNAAGQMSFCTLLGSTLCSHNMWEQGV